MVTSKYLSSDLLEWARDQLGVKTVDSFSKYLGLPISFNRNRTSLFKILEERMLKKTMDWKNKMLSIGGKEILIKTVLQAIPVYAMSCFKLPKQLCKSLNDIITRFWWRKKMEDKTIHWINSKTLRKGKIAGGMGFRDFDLFNLALLAKQAWRVMTQPNALVSRILKAKYFPQSNMYYALRRQNNSFAWQSILQGLIYLKQGVSFPDGGNNPLWIGDDSGAFTVKSGYNFFFSINQRFDQQSGEASDPTQVSSFWSSLWKLNLPNKIKIFAWKLYHDAIPSMENLARRGCVQVLQCQSCGAKVETSLHVFRDCWCAKSFLAKLGINEDILSIDCTDPGYWLWTCAKMCSKEQFRRLLCGLWFLWFRRNSALFDDNELGINTLYVKFNFFLSQLDSQLCLNVMGPRNPYDEKDCICICCDGSWSGADSAGGWSFVASADGLILAAGAGWNEGIPSCHVMEGLALLAGLKFAAAHQWNKVIFKLDSALVFRAVILGQCHDSLDKAWLLACWELLELFPNWSVLIVPRDDVVLADRLARRARAERWIWECPDAIPCCISPVL